MDFWTSPEALILATGLPIAVAVVVVAHAVARRSFRPASRAAAELAVDRAVSVPEPVVATAPPRRRLIDALAKTREAFRRRLDDVLGRGGDQERVLEELEEVLVAADVGINASTKILARIRAGAGEQGASLHVLLRRAIEESLGNGQPTVPTTRPWVILVAGVNGVGKTTSIGKLAHRFQSEGKKVLLVAADTFRAAAIDQLAVWGERVGVDVVRHQSGSDPAAVAFDGVKAAKAREVDVVLVDTAGRLHTKQNLVEELRKVARVVGRELPGAPHEVLLVLDATTGQNALAQARVFTEAIGVTGIVLSKLDGTAKGGAALAVREELGLPIQYVGVGEAIDDLRRFSPGEFAGALLGDEGS
jgi:fused signal recognition particle receptor